MLPTLLCAMRFSCCICDLHSLGISYVVDCEITFFKIFGCSIGGCMDFESLCLFNMEIWHTQDQCGIMRILSWESSMWECLHKTSPFSVMGLPLLRYVLCCCNTIIQDSKYRYISNSYFFFKALFLLFKGGCASYVVQI